MDKKTTASMVAIVACLVTFIAAPVLAQSPTRATTQDATSEHHQRIYQLMKDMSQKMGEMTEQMSSGNVTAEQREQMSQHMELMSTMMHRMSGLAARPAMNNAESLEQMEQMRVQMDKMIRDPAMKPTIKK